jgi:eukaryotic-like serine/threonine-protein kinase
MSIQSHTDWERLRTLFDRALPLGAAEREALLADAVLSPQLAADLRALLRNADTHSGSASEDITQNGSSHSAFATSEGFEAASGLQLGAWRLVSPLGAGGMGEVWRAERSDGRYQGNAAIKLLKHGMGSQGVLQRFSLEQQALARLAHPHIARLLDAGLSPRGVPYFVMELVDDARPIDRACEGKSLADRLGLFLQLADAVSHAHRNLLVHRDLKPSNVLVSKSGQVKLLDFGIAKALTADAADVTQQDRQPYTPHYASPEQVRGEPVSTATDLYSLGVLLYVMLTGQRPYGRSADNPQAAARAVLDEQPTRPSSVATPEPGWETTRKQLVGDLDNILLKALEKDPDRRYASVDAFAADVRAYLGGYPVSAQAVSAVYVLRKFVARNPWGVLAGGLGALGVVSGLAASVMSERLALGLGVIGLAAGLALALVQARQAALARDAADAAKEAAQARLAQIKRMTTDLVFRHGDAVNQLPGGSASQEALLNETVAVLLPAVDAAPDDGDLLAMAASAVSRLAEIQGNHVTAAPERIPQARKSIALALSLGARAWPTQKADWRFAGWYMRTHDDQVALWRREGKLDDAVALLARASAQAEESLALQTDAEGRAQMGTAVANLELLRAQILDHPIQPSLHQPDAAIDALAKAKAAYESMLAQPEVLAEHDRLAPPGGFSANCYFKHQIGTTLGSRALILMRQNKPHEALPFIEQAFAQRSANVQAEPHIVGWRDGLMAEANNHAQILLMCGQPQAALDASQLARDTAAQLASDEGPSSKWAGIGPLLSANWAGALIALGRHGEARAVIDEFLPQLQAKTTANPQDQSIKRQLERLLALQGELG